MPGRKHSPGMVGTTESPPLPLRLRPASIGDLFWVFTSMAMQGFGGVVAVVQRELVERRQWLTREEFIEDWAVAQILPGPNVINLSLMLGDRYFGPRGALAAMSGLLAVPLVIVLILAVLFSSVSSMPVAQGAMRGMGAVVAGLIAATGLRLISALRQNVMGLMACGAFCAATFVAIALVRLPLVGVLLGFGGVASIWAWRQIGRITARATARSAP
jgi:chromate transporter